MNPSSPPHDKDSPRARMLEGTLVQMPTMISSIPFGIVIGVLGAAGGLGFFECIALAAFPMSATVFLVSLQMTNESAPALIIVATIMVMNMRMIMYSASIAPWLPKLTWPMKLATAYCINDQTFAFAMVNFNRHPDRPNKHWHLIGGGLYSLAVWVPFTAVGYLAGTTIPPSWSLDFGGTLTFLTLLVRSVNSVPTAAAAVAAAAMSIAAWTMPLKLGMAAAILTGVVAGSLIRKAAR